MATGLGFPPDALTKKWFGEEQRDCVYPQARALLPGLGAQCPAQSLDPVGFAKCLFDELMKKGRKAGGGGRGSLPVPTHL